MQLLQYGYNMWKEFATQGICKKICAKNNFLREDDIIGEALPVPCQMINCFCMYSDYTPLTLEEWVECDQKRRAPLCM